MPAHVHDRGSCQLLYMGLRAHCVCHRAYLHPQTLLQAVVRAKIFNKASSKASQAGLLSAGQPRLRLKAHRVGPGIPNFTGLHDGTCCKEAGHAP